MVPDDRQPVNDELHCISSDISSFSNYFALDSIAVPEVRAKTHWKAGQEASFQLLYVLCNVIKSDIFLSHLFEFNARFLSSVFVRAGNSNDTWQISNEAFCRGACLCG